MPAVGKAANATALETTKRTTAKAAAAAIVITMASDVALDTAAGYASAAKKAHDLGRRYDELAANRLP